MKKYLVALIKITDHPEDLVEGNLYCNRLGYFVESEEKEIGDSKEATAIVSRPHNIFNRLYRFNIQDSELLNSPVFCLYGVLGDKYCDTSKIHFDNKRLMAFGERAVIIKDVRRFLNQVDKNQPQFSYSIVRYIDFSNPRGEDERAIFNPIVKKDLRFRYQKEFRIYSHHVDLEGAKTFYIGDLRNFTEICETEELYVGKDVDLKVDWNHCDINNFDRTTRKSWGKLEGSPT
ncbi:hypothetical protein CEB3_c31290 [Peptococcaceae bacterium CEB3]|nr:hypothetical protein CEB3_c31290 [Peptococcaceae bacterium CEB3]